MILQRLSLYKRFLGLCPPHPDLLFLTSRANNPLFVSPGESPALQVKSCSPHGYTPFFFFPRPLPVLAPPPLVSPPPPPPFCSINSPPSASVKRDDPPPSLGLYWSQFRPPPPPRKVVFPPNFYPVEREFLVV